MSDEKTTLRGTSIYALEIPKIAKANKVEFEGREQDAIIKDLEAIPDDQFISVDPETQKAVKDPAAGVLDYVTATPGSSCKEIAEQTMIPVKTVSSVLNDLFKEGKVIRQFDDQKTYRYYLDGAEVTQSKTNSEMKTKTKKAAKAPTKKAAKKSAGKTGGVKRNGVVAEIRALLDKGKTREQILAMDKYNKSTIYVQAGKWAKEQKKKK